MQRRSSILPIFVIFLFLTVLVGFSSYKGWFGGVGGIVEQLVLPIQRGSVLLFHPRDTSEIAEVKEENRKLLTQLTKQKELEKENNALRDQFETTTPSSKKLLPALIIGQLDDHLIIDKGTSDDVRVGQIIVYEQNLIGQVSQVSRYRAVISVVTAPKTSFTAITKKTQSLGVISGLGGQGMVLDKVVLSDKLEKGDVVVTKGDVDAGGNGYPPDLIVGKIVSVNKKASNLFQQAEVRSLVNRERLTMVFILKE